MTRPVVNTSMVSFRVIGKADDFAIGGVAVPRSKMHSTLLRTVSADKVR